MVTKREDGTRRKRSRSQAFRKRVPGSPQGIFQPRIQAVGPETFGVVAIDCARARSKWMLVDFYGNMVSQPASVEHNRNAFQPAVLTLQQAMEKHDLKDVIVAVEMTVTYHKPPMRAFREAGLETRLVHPLASSFYRQAEHSDEKTDDNQLDAIFRAAVNGFGMQEKPVDSVHHRLQTHPFDRDEPSVFTASLPRSIFSHQNFGPATGARTRRNPNSHIAAFSFDNHSECRPRCFLGSSRNQVRRYSVRKVQ